MRLLATVRALGITVTADGDQLIVSPASRLPPELRAQLRAAKPAILAHLRAEAAPHPPAEPPPPLKPPLLASAPADTAPAVSTPAPIPRPRRQPSWSDVSAEPLPDDTCSCCRGSRFWTEQHEPRGWRCCTCHPPPPGRAVRRVRANANPKEN